MRQTILAVLSLSAMTALLTGCGGDMVLLNSKGPVAAGQSNLMMTAIYLMLIGGYSINHHGIMVRLEISCIE